MPKKPKPIWTQHALQRIDESPIKMEYVKSLFKKANLISLKKKIEDWKFQRYGMKAVNTSFYKVTLELLYTVSDETGEIITFTVKDPGTKEVWGKDLLN